MIYISIGITGFILLLLFDVCSLCDKSIIKYFFGISGFSLIAGSSVFLIQMESYASFSLSIIALAFAIVSLFLLIYSVFIEVGKKTYEYDNSNTLITTGTYALSRHPGVLWFLFLYLFGAVYFQNHLVLYAGLIWTVMNIIYVIIQERFIFTKLFEGYSSYIQTTPMILPSNSSLGKCITTLNWRK